MMPPTAPHIYFIAGETSGDQLGAGLMNALRENSSTVRFFGIGGRLMQSAGLLSLFPMEELSLMGFAEILPHIFRLKRRIRQTVSDIERNKPDIVLTIDSPGFVFRVVEALRKKGYTHSRFIHYVAPTVWAYKPERAIRTARLFDALLTLFSFEVSYFAKEGLATHWVGHPAAWKTPIITADTSHALCAFPGSRPGELKRHLPLYREITALLVAKHPKLTMTMPIPLHVHEQTTRLTRNWPCPLNIIDSNERKKALANAPAALCKSGTITLETALAGVPAVITFKANPISVWLARRMIHIPYAGLPNILLGREVMPEFLQPKHAAPIADALDKLLQNGAEAETQRAAFGELKELLLPSTSESPSELAAKQLLSYAARKDAVSSS